jgi:hypothetical protein
MLGLRDMEYANRKERKSRFGFHDVDEITSNKKVFSHYKDKVTDRFKQYANARGYTNVTSQLSRISTDKDYVGLHRRKK